jgi:predicted dehydrogenase
MPCVRRYHVAVRPNPLLPSRRQFLQTLATVTAASAFAQPAGPKRYRAVIIGSTGRGNYGHELDLLFTDHPRIDVVAIADPDEAGRSKAAARAKTVRQYADFQTMLNREKPDLVCVAPRWTDEHFTMIKAALDSGAHVFTEKPFAQTLADADALLGIAKKADRKIAVAQQMRLAPGILFLKSALERGIIGDLVEIRAFGKQDNRAGAEDMLVLGVHLFDLMRFFAGDAQWCFAQVREKGHEITKADAHKATEGIGLIAGNEVYATYGFASGVRGSFTSSARLRQTTGPWGLELVGTKGVVRILADVFPRLLILKPGAFVNNTKSDHWQPIEGDPTVNATTAERDFVPANRRVLDDWLNAIEQGREPICNGAAGTKAIEMVMAVYQSALSHSRVEIPLANRTHPLA